MAKRMVRNVSAAMLLAACSTAMGVDNSQALPAAASELLRMYPGTHVSQDQGRVRIIYGMPMTPGMNARNAAQNWIQQHGAAFGCGELEVAEVYNVPFVDGSKTAISYQQSIGGIPVEYGALKVLVLNGAVPQVVYAAGTLAQPPEDGFPAPALTGEAAVQIVKAMPVWRRVPQWSKAELVVYQGTGEQLPPVLTWKFVGESPVVSDALRKTFFVDAQTGTLVHTRDEVLTIDVNGSLKGMGSPGLLPDESYNPPALINIPEMRASITGGNNVFSDLGGLFTIPHGGTTEVTVTASTNGSGAGRWVNVVPQAGGGPILTGSVNAIPPGPANLILNPAPSELLTAQVNAFVSTTITHNYFKSRAPSFTGLDIQIPANTGVSGNCNAFFNGSSINFYNRLNGCANTAFSTVVSHEYGHFIVNRLGLAQGGFGEGYSDVTAMMIWDDNIIGRGFRQGINTFVRDPLTANIQYPCSSTAVHTCGQIVGAVWWRIRTNMGAFYGSQPGLDQTRQMQVNWSLITIGGTGSNSLNSAHPGTAEEVLTVDDNDGNINNGTPNYSRICPAFAAHSIACPAFSPVTFQYPSGRPAEIAINQPTPISVNIVSNGATPTPGTGTVSNRIGGGSFPTVPMAQGAPNSYTATLPPVSCAQDIQYYFSVDSSSGPASDPANAPASFFTASATLGTTSTTVASHDFSTDPGWTVVNDASLTTGAWERVTPAAGAGTGTPSSAFGGSGMCWVTDNRSGNFDVDGGPTTILTSVYDLSGYPRVTVSYQRWLYSSGSDPWTFGYSTDGGSTWTNLESLGGTSTAAWTARSFTLTNLTATTRFRWTLSDNPNNSVAEGGLDQFILTGVTCPGGCYANCDGSTGQPLLNVNDFVCFQNLFAAGSPSANCDGSTTQPVLNVNDFICFQNAYSAGCP